MNIKAQEGEVDSTWKQRDGNRSGCLQALSVLFSLAFTVKLQFTLVSIQSRNELNTLEGFNKTHSV